MKVRQQKHAIHNRYKPVYGRKANKLGGSASQKEEACCREGRLLFWRTSVAYVAMVTWSEMLVYLQQGTSGCVFILQEILPSLTTKPINSSPLSVFCSENNIRLFFKDIWQINFYKCWGRGRPCVWWHRESENWNFAFSWLVNQKDTHWKAESTSTRGLFYFLKNREDSFCYFICWEVSHFSAVCS